jgi:hypothetical protein
MAPKTKAKKTYNSKSKSMYKPKARVSRPRNYDGMSGICSAYFEITRKNDQGIDLPLSYVIACDANKPEVKLLSNAVANGNTGLSTDKGDGSELISVGTSEADMHLAKYVNLSSNYLQYKVNSVQVKVLVDKHCLDNQICFSTDRGDDSPIQNMREQMAGAGKRHTPTEAKREFNYGWKASTTQEKEWITTNSSLAAKDTNHIKIFQALEKAPAGGASCTHRVSVLVSYSLKDSNNLN